MSLEGKVVVIFGGSSGMGKAAAKAVVSSGGVAWITGRSEARLQAAKAEIGGAPDAVRTTSVDLEDENAVKGFFDAIEPGTIHHLIVTAGASNDTADIRGAKGFAGLKTQFNIKFFAQLVPVSYGADKLAAGGSITFTSGALAKRPGKGAAALGAVNAALDFMCKALANDLGPRLRVNTLSPGLTDTEIWNNMPAEVKKKMLEGFGSRIPAGRAGRAEDVGHAFKFLLEN